MNQNKKELIKLNFKVKLEDYVLKNKYFITSVALGRHN